jgi:hypothetical protein
MNLRQLAIGLLAASFLLFPCSTPTANAQLSSQKRREMERKRKDFERKQRMSGNYRSPNSTLRSKKYGGSSSPKPYQSEPKSSKTRYVFRRGQSLAYAIEINGGNQYEQRYWAGVMLLTTKEPTQLRDDGSPYGSARLAVWGHIEGYIKDGENMVRVPDEDIHFPESAVFETTGCNKFSYQAEGRKKLPYEMSLRYRIIDAIFPNTTLMTKNEQKQTKRSYMLQKFYGSIGGFSGYLNGNVNITRRVSGTSTFLKEVFSGSNKDGSITLDYSTQQTGSFSSSGALIRSNTSFQADWQDKRQQVNVTVTQIPAQQVIAAFSKAEP